MTYRMFRKTKGWGQFIFAILSCSSVPMIALADHVFRFPDQEAIGTHTIVYQGLWGKFKREDRCQRGSAAFAVRVKIEPPQGKKKDDTALNAIQLKCRNSAGRVTDVGLKSQEGQWGNWSEWFSCSTGHFFVSAEIKYEPNQKGRDDTAANGIKLLCSDNKWIKPPESQWGKWEKFKNWYGGSNGRCAQGSVILGMITQVEEPQGGKDDTALNGVMFSCGPLGS